MRVFFFLFAMDDGSDGTSLCADEASFVCQMELSEFLRCSLEIMKLISLTKG